MPPSTDLVTVQQVEDVLLHGGDLAVVDPDAIQTDMVERILKADTLAGAFSDFKSVSASEMEGVEIAIHGIAWMRSTFPDGPKVYALLDCHVVETDEQVTVSMGGRTTMAGMLWAQRNSAMPFSGVFRKEKSNQDNGNSFWTFKLA
jgi:hypothetical protein